MLGFFTVPRLALNPNLILEMGSGHSVWAQRKGCTANSAQNGVINGANFHGPWGTGRNT
jgi:hypothetical protein